MPDQQRTQSTLSQPMQRAKVDGAGTELEYEILGSPAGEPVVLIHGALIADAFAPLLAEPVLATRYRLIRYHRRGYAGSTHPPGRSASPSRPPTAGRCCGTWASSGRTSSATPPAGPSPCSWRWTRRRSCTPWSCWSRGCSDVPSGPLFAAALEPAIQAVPGGGHGGAVDGFLRVAIGRDYRSLLERVIPGGYAQVVADADTFLGAELPALGAWRFTREDARRITQPVLSVLGGESATDWAGWPEVHARVQEWLPQAEPFVLAGANHALEDMDPRGVAEALAAFFARHPIPAPALAGAR